MSVVHWFFALYLLHKSLCVCVVGSWVGRAGLAVMDCDPTWFCLLRQFIKIHLDGDQRIHWSSAAL